MAREPAQPLRRVLLDLPPKGGPHRKAPRSSLSALARVDDRLFVGSDEGIVLDRLRRTGPDRWGEPVQLPLLDVLDLPNRSGVDDEIDVEGLDVAGGSLWVVGSHTWTRSKPADDPPRDLAAIRANPNRHVLARLSLPDATMGARLAIHAEEGALPAALRGDAHLDPFLRLPSKENGFDIEGIAVRGERVLLGLRGPVLRGFAIVLEVTVREDGPGRLALVESAAGIGRKHFLDLGGNGVRDLHRDGDDLLILAGPTAAIDGRCAIWRWRQPWREPADSFTEPGPRLERLMRIPVGDDDDHPEAFVVLPGPDGPGILVGYDAPAAARKVGKGAVYADLFRLPG